MDMVVGEERMLISGGNGDSFIPSLALHRL